MKEKIILLILAFIALQAEAHPPFECMLPGDSLLCCPLFPIVVNETLLRECMHQTFRERKGFECAFECYTNATKMYINGKIDKTYATNSMVSFIKPEFAQWKPILTKGIEKCANDANNDTFKEMEKDEEEHTRPHPHHHEKCNKRSGYFLACVGGQMFQNCPTDVWSNTTRCEEYKGVVKKCNVYLPPPPHHRHHRHGHHHHHHHHHPHHHEEEPTAVLANDSNDDSVN